MLQLQQLIRTLLRCSLTLIRMATRGFLTDGIVRARYRNGTAKAAEVVPGQVYKYTIDLWATGNVFKAGHRIRLYVSSSNFPRFDRNLNLGEPIATSSRSKSCASDDLSRSKTADLLSGARVTAYISAAVDEFLKNLLAMICGECYIAIRPR